MLVNDLFYIEEFSNSDTLIEACIRLNPDHVILKGHFPGQPVVPGVCLIQLIKEVAGLVLQKELTVIAASSIKFLKMIEPAAVPFFLLRVSLTRNEEEFLKVDATLFDGENIFMKLKGQLTFSAGFS
jgi:3-hydroxyacyl-[acyl-carrier-protein] dehydratase